MIWKVMRSEPEHTVLHNFYCSNVPSDMSFERMNSHVGTLSVHPHCKATWMNTYVNRMSAFKPFILALKYLRRNSSALQRPEFSSQQDPKLAPFDQSRSRKRRTMKRTFLQNLLYEFFLLSIIFIVATVRVWNYVITNREFYCFSNVSANAARKLLVARRPFASSNNGRFVKHFCSHFYQTLYFSTRTQMWVTRGWFSSPNGKCLLACTYVRANTYH